MMPPKQPVKVRSHERYNPHSGDMIDVRGYERRQSFRERLAEASGGASEDLPFVAATAGVAVGTCTATAVTAVAYGAAAAAGIFIAVTAVAYKGVTKWAAKRGVELPDLPTPKRGSGEIDAQKITERAERRTRNRERGKAATSWTWNQVKLGRDTAARDAVWIIRTAGRIYRLITKRFHGRRRVVRGRELD
jgi:hypothetical protein